jgi:ribosomal protein S12 methylthiotransferase accessory factor
MIPACLPPRLRRAVSPRTGIVAAVEECLHLPTEPPLHRFASRVGRQDGLLGSPADHLSETGGTGLTRGEAVAAAVGEALERYSGTFVPDERLVVASASELGPDAVEPRRFALFSDSQYLGARFPFRPFAADSRVAWVEGLSLPDRVPCWLPAELVFLGDTVVSGCRRIGYATSSGMACAETIDDALVRGLCEVLERDAFMIVWANRLSLPLLEWSGEPRFVELDHRLFVATGLEYAAIDLSGFHRLPSVAGVVRAPAGVPGALGVGAGTDPSLERAWWKALSEAFAARAAAAKLALLDPGRKYGPRGAGVVSFADHIAYYANAGRAKATSFLDESPERSPVSGIPALEGASPAGHVASLCARVEEAGSNAYAVDVTAPDVRELGLVVMKVVAPELCSLDAPHEARFLGGRRLYDTDLHLGLRAPGGAAELNPEPHPFP